jgi:hypothetical protein
MCLVFVAVSPESIVIPIVSCILGFPLLALLVICCLRRRAKLARERARRRAGYVGMSKFVWQYWISAPRRWFRRPFWTHYSYLNKHLSTEWGKSRYTVVLFSFYFLLCIQLHVIFVRRKNGQPCYFTFFGAQPVCRHCLHIHGGCLPHCDTLWHKDFCMSTFHSLCKTSTRHKLL